MMLIKILMALAAVAFVGYPLLRQWTGEEEVELPEEVEELHRRKESTYSALKELEFDFRTGKLSESDYRELDTKYRADAVEILEAISEAETPAAKPKSPSRAKQTGARQPRPAAGQKNVSAAAPSAPRASQAGDGQLVCLACDHLNPAGASFCAGCGDHLLEQSAVAVMEASPNGHAAGECEECGAPVKAGARFCGGCGAEVIA